MQESELLADNDRTVTISPDGTTISKDFVPDPRWGRAATHVRRLSIKAPSGFERIIDEARRATLTTPTDAFSVQQMVTTSSDNDDVWTSTYAGFTRTTTLVSPLGRSRSVTVDARGPVTKSAVNGLAPIQLAYDARGRIQSIAQGSGADIRTATLLIGRRMGSLEP